MNHERMQLEMENMSHGRMTSLVQMAKKAGTWSFDIVVQC